MSPTAPSDPDPREPTGPAGGSSADRQAIRATDDERRRAAEELAAALGRGQLDLAEFDDRTNQVWSARTRAELAGPLEDLVPDPLSIVRDPTAARHLPDVSPAARPDLRPDVRSDHRDLSAVAKAHVTGETGGTAVSLAVMFGNDQSGEWLCPARHTAVALMGGVSIDLRRARLQSAHTEITAVAIMGGVEIIVPEDIRLSVAGTGLMGGFASSQSREVVIAGHDLPPDAPTVRVTGLALMGGVDVRRAPRSGGGRRELPGRSRD